MTRPVDLPFAGDQDLKLFGAFGDITLKTHESHKPAWWREVRSDQGSIAIGPCLLPDESIVLTGIGIDATECRPRGIRLRSFSRGCFGRTPRNRKWRCVAAEMRDRAPQNQRDQCNC